MTDLNYISSYYPAHIATRADFQKHILKEYIQLMVLDYLSSSPYIGKLAFIGGTNLRLIKGIDRFSEDLDFDCKSLTEQEFIKMTDDIIVFLRREGLSVEARDKANAKLTAFRRNIYFPEFLFELGLSGHKEERFLLKIEAQDQAVAYSVEMNFVQRCGFFFSLPTPSISVLLSMKLSALLARAKGRDFYPEELKQALKSKLATIDLNVKKRDFEHLLFDSRSAGKILRFADFVELNL